MPDCEKTKHVTQGQFFFALFVAYLLMSFAFSPMAAGESAMATRLFFWAVCFGVCIAYLVASYRAGYWRHTEDPSDPG